MYNIKAKALIDEHFHGMQNPATPVVIEIGWIIEDKIAYELSRNDKRNLFGLTCIERFEDGSHRERRDMRRSGKTEAEIRAALQEVKGG